MNVHCLDTKEAGGYGGGGGEGDDDSGGGHVPNQTTTLLSCVCIFSYHCWNCCVVLRYYLVKTHTSKSL